MAHDQNLEKKKVKKNFLNKKPLTQIPYPIYVRRMIRKREEDSEILKIWEKPKVNLKKYIGVYFFLLDMVTASISRHFF